MATKQKTFLIKKKKIKWYKNIKLNLSNKTVFIHTVRSVVRGFVIKHKFSSILFQHDHYSLSILDHKTVFQKTHSNNNFSPQSSYHFQSHVKLLGISILEISISPSGMVLIESKLESLSNIQSTLVPCILSKQSGKPRLFRLS